ncbi:protein SRC2-like [Cucumis melo]|uniref:Protein SRC2-like n=1 Tax=Cucumis melo TaxID=3656 RepID=A0ABM3LCQ5_CUCME|nr:protein SRC2-like [Cucumis melo]
MDLLSLEISVDSAEDLKKPDTYLPSRVKAYVVVSVTSGVFSEQRAQTNVDMEGGENPRWNFPMNFLIDLNAAKQDLNSLLTFTIKSETPQVHKCIGEIKVRILELFESVGDQNSMRYISRPIMDAFGRTRNARLNFIFSFREVELQESVTHEEISHLNEKIENVKNMNKRIAKDVAVRSNRSMAISGFATGLHATSLVKKYIDGTSSSEAATSTTSDTSDGSISVLDIIFSFFS